MKRSLAAFLLDALASRVPRAELPPRADGVAVLAGSLSRVDALCGLAERFPEARLLFIGGAGPTRSGRPHQRIAAEARMRSLGLDPARVQFEPRSGNTYENARFAAELVGEAEIRRTWLLVTSDWHMPRALRCFRAAGWNATPCGCRDAGRLDDGDGGPGSLLVLAVREWCALLAYRWRI